MSPALYYQLILIIISSKLWPYVVPGAEWAMEKLILDIKNQGACLLKVLIDRVYVINDKYNSLAIAEMAFLVSALIHPGLITEGKRWDSKTHL